MRRYDTLRTPPDRALVQRTRDALGSLFGAIAAGDEGAIRDLLATDVRALSDAGGEFLAALKPIEGREKVVRFLLKLTHKYGPPAGVRWVELNGLPAVVLEFADPPPRISKRSVLRCDLDRDGRIRELHIVIASHKLRGVHARPL